MDEIVVQDVIEALTAADVEVGLNALDPDVPLAEQGVDSLDMMNVFFTLEKRFSVELGDDIDLSEWETINRIVQNLNNLR